MFSDFFSFHFVYYFRKSKNIFMYLLSILLEWLEHFNTIIVSIKTWRWELIELIRDLSKTDSLSASSSVWNSSSPGCRGFPHRLGGCSCVPHFGCCSFVDFHRLGRHFGMGSSIRTCGFDRSSSFWSWFRLGGLFWRCFYFWGLSRSCFNLCVSFWSCVNLWSRGWFH